MKKKEKKKRKRKMLTIKALLGSRKVEFCLVCFAKCIGHLDESIIFILRIIFVII